MAPGIVAVTSNFIGRYTEFNLCFSRLRLPPGAEVSWEAGINIAQNCNVIIREMPMEAEWLWFMDDDHVFDPDILERLLTHDVDIVVPLVLHRVRPFPPVIYSGQEGGWECLGWDAIRGKRGLVPVEAHGKAGMLIKRHVFDTLADPWFEMGQINPEKGSMDLWFCHKARQAGFHIYVDTDTWMGHVTHMAIWPVKDIYDNWQPEVRSPRQSKERDQVIETRAQAPPPEDIYMDWDRELAQFFALHDEAAYREYLTQVTD